MTNQGFKLMSRRGGFTLIETLVAMTASSVLLLSMGSMIVLTTRAIPSGEGRGSLAADASHNLQRMCDDLVFAQAVTIGESELLVLIPDQTGDGIAEQVVYWLDTGVLYKGVSRSDPDPVTLMDGVTGFVIEPDSGSVVYRSVRLALTIEELGVVETSAETLARPARP